MKFQQFCSSAYTSPGAETLPLATFIFGRIVTMAVILLYSASPSSVSWSSLPATSWTR